MNSSKQDLKSHVTKVRIRNIYIFAQRRFRIPFHLNIQIVRYE